MAVSLVCVMLAFAAFGGLTPGPQVPDAPDRGATLGDFNGDGLTDHVYSSYFLINQGGGNFTKHDFVLPEPHTNVIATMDVNGDGRSDLITEKLGFFPPGATQPRPPETYRLHIIGSSNTALAYLERKGRDYVGTAYVKTACGSSHIEMIVTPR